MRTQKAKSVKLFGFELEPKTTMKFEVKSNGVTGEVIVVGERFKKKLDEVVNLPQWFMKHLLENKAVNSFFSNAEWPQWFVLLKNASAGSGELVASSYAKARDFVGVLAPEINELKIENLKVSFWGASAEEIKGSIVGLEMGLYNFKGAKEDTKQAKIHFSFFVDGKPIKSSVVTEAGELGLAINFTRHLVNQPANILYPETYAKSLESVFATLGNVEVEVWREEKLKKENLNLLLAVGEGSPRKPRLVILRYRPRGAKKSKPIAFIGKGITFDSGGMDLKGSSFMRLMKKDMGGSATVAGLCWWMSRTGVKTNCDFYLPLSENMADGEAFKPGDIFVSRKGLEVEIHNTDAEGRLVLADAFSVATDSEPAMLIDVATLTGAIRIALGKSIGGLFANDIKLKNKIYMAGLNSGDFLWPMPLFENYLEDLKSTPADIVNSGEGFGGGITAALFLQKFVTDVPWAHLDIYAWIDKAKGACVEAGANGQALQALAQFVSKV